MNASHSSLDSVEVQKSREQRMAIDQSLRDVGLHWISSALFWLLGGTLLALITSIKMHDVGFLADNPWLTFGRVRPAHLNTMVYGWASAGCVLTGLWTLARPCRVPPRQTWTLHLAAILWNIGNAIGTWGILKDDSTSHEWLEYPRHTGPWIVTAFAIVMAHGVDMICRCPAGHI